jgi:hypothetical protein
MRKSQPTGEDMLGAMIALSNRVPDVPLQSACLAIGEVLAANGATLAKEDQAKLVMLGAALWRKCQELGEDVLDVHHVEGGEQ